MGDGLVMARLLIDKDWDQHSHAVRCCSVLYLTVPKVEANENEKMAFVATDMTRLNQVSHRINIG